MKTKASTTAFRKEARRKAHLKKLRAETGPLRIMLRFHEGRVRYLKRALARNGCHQAELSASHHRHTSKKE